MTAAEQCLLNLHARVIVLEEQAAAQQSLAYMSLIWMADRDPQALEALLLCQRMLQQDYARQGKPTAAFDRIIETIEMARDTPLPRKPIRPVSVPHKD